MDLGPAGDSISGGEVEVPPDVESLALSEDEKRATWTRLRKYYEPRLGQGVTVQSLACDQPWVASRSTDRIDDFISLSWDELLETKGLGKKKCDLLLKIFYDAMSCHPQGLTEKDPVTSESSVSQNPTLLSKLTELAIPVTFPIALCRFSVRVKELCNDLNLATIGDLILFVERTGIDALLEHENIGARSVQEILDFRDSIALKNRDSLADVLPYDVQTDRFSFLGAARSLLKSLTEQTRTVVTERLLRGSTLQAVGDTLDVSRERVRQLESAFLDDLRQYLEWFEEDRIELFGKLEFDQSIIEAFAELHSADDAAICAAGVERLFHLSDEGRQLEQDQEALFESWIIELDKTVPFHLGHIKLTAFVIEMGNEPLAKDFVAYGKRNRAFNFDAETDIIAPSSITPKGVVGALLWQAQRDMEVAEILSALSEVKEFSHFGQHQLRRSYDTWKRDPDFSPYRIIFPTSVLSLPRSDDAGRPVIGPKIELAARKVRLPPSCSAELLECNRLVTETIARFSTPTILGLLPFSSDEQTRIVSAVIEEHGNSLRRLELLLELAPGAVAYSFAFAAGSEMETSAFWDPIEKGLRITIHSLSRPELTEAFRRAVHTLGLIEASVRASNHLWPILFQAGIVPQFVPQLADHIGRFLEGKPPPDYEDEEELTQFALAIRDRIPKAWVRLREILETASGRRACAAILQAHRADDFDLLPPHLRQKMREAFKSVTRHFFATPHLVFQVNAEQVTLCLPKQPPKLLTPASCWQVGDTRTFPATETSIVAVECFKDPTVEVLLKNLVHPVADWSREFSLFPSDARPVQVFALPHGRELRVDSKATGHVALPFGNYAILVSIAARSNIEEGWQISGERHKWIEYSSYPGQIVLEVVLDKIIRFTPRDEPAILVLPTSGGRIPTIDDEPIYYGERLSVSLHIPANEIAEESEYTLLLADGAGLLNESFTFPGASLLHNPELTEIDPRWITEGIGRLPCGIHQLTFGLRSNRRVSRRSVWFWKKFSHTRGEFGYVCASPTSNIDFAASVGIRPHQDGIALASSFSGSEIALALNAPAVVLRLPRPGVSISLQNAATGACVPVALGRSIEFGPDDMRRLIVNINETLPCELLAGHTVIRAFEEGAGSFTQRVQAFFHEFGEATPLFWRVKDGTPKRLLTITKLAVANGFVFTLSAGTMSYRGAFKLSKQYQQLVVAYRNLISGQTCQSASLNLEPGTRAVPLPLFGDLHFRVQESGDDNYIEFFRDQREIANGLFSLEFSCRKQSTDEWTALRICELTGVAGSRVFIVSNPLVPENSWWSSIVCATWNNYLGDVQALPEIGDDTSESDLRIAFAQLNYALDYTYCDNAWNSIKWIRGVYDCLCAGGFRRHAAVVTCEAVKGLAHKAEDNDALYRPLIFGSLEELWCSEGQVFGEIDYPPNTIGRAFEILFALSRCRSLTEFFSLPLSRGVDIFALRYLDQKSKTYRYGSFFKDTASAVLEDESDLPEVILLSPHHFRQCFENLRRNVDVLLTVRDFEDPALLGRGSAVTSLLTFGNRLIVLEGFVKAKMAIPNIIAFDIDVYSPSPGPEIRRCILLLTALSRLCARGKVSRKEFHEQIRNVFGAPEGDVQNIQKGMTLLLDLAPELFACAMLLWDIVLFDQP